MSATLDFALAKNVYHYDIEKEKLTMESAESYEKRFRDFKNNSPIPDYMFKELEKLITGQIEYAEKQQFSVEPEALEELLRKSFIKVKIGLEKTKGLCYPCNDSILMSLVKDETQKFALSLENYISFLEDKRKDERRKRIEPVKKIILDYSKGISHSDYEKWILLSIGRAKKAGEKIPEFDLKEMVEYFESWK